MFEDLISGIESIKAKDTAFRNAIIKMAKTNLVYISGDKRFSNDRGLYTPKLYEDLTDDMKAAIENSENFVEYMPQVLDKTKKLLLQDTNYRMWKTVFCQEAPEAKIFTTRVNCLKIEYEEMTYVAYGRDKNGMSLQLKKNQNKLMLLLFNKNGTFNIFKIAESKQDVSQKASCLNNFDSDIQEYDRGISSKFYPINTALLLEGILKANSSELKEEIRKIAENNPASTFSNLYNFVLEQKLQLGEKVEKIFNKLSLVLNGKFFTTRKEEELIEIKNVPIRYVDPYCSYNPSHSLHLFEFEAKTKYRTEVSTDYLLINSLPSRLEFVTEKRFFDAKREAMYAPLFPKEIALDATLGFGVKFEENFIYEEQELRAYCKKKNFTLAFTTATINMFKNLKDCIFHRIQEAERALDGTENLQECENLLVTACKELDTLNVAPMKTTYLLNQI